MRLNFNHCFLCVLVCCTLTTSAQQCYTLEQLFTINSVSNKSKSPAIVEQNNNLLYTQLLQLNDAAQYKRYLMMFPKSTYYTQVQQHLCNVLYTYAQSYDAVHSLQKFSALYPYAVQTQDAKNKVDALIFDTYKHHYSIPSLKKFILENPNNTMLPIAYDKLYNLYITALGTNNGSAKYVLEMPNAYNAAMAWNALFDSYSYNYLADSVNAFKSRYKSTYKGTTNLNDALLTAQLQLIPKQDSITQLWGYTIENGMWEIAPQFLKVDNFYEGYAVIETTLGSNYITKKGEKLLPLDAEECNAFSYGIAVITTNNKDGCINRMAKTVVPNNYLYLSNYNGQYIKAQNNESLYGAITVEEDWLVQPTFKNLESLNNYLNSIRKH
jgi:hypothetical protein